MSRILFITPSQPSINPRLRKAADALAESGCTVHVLHSWRAKWATQADNEIFRNSYWTHQQIGGNPINQKLPYFFSRLRRKVSELTGNLEDANCRAVKEFIREGIFWKPDLVIGHNLGAFFPALSIANRLNIHCLSDAEDFYRGETLDESRQNQVKQLEDRWINHFSAVTTAAPLISKRYKSLYPNQRFITVNNAFPAEYGAPHVTSFDGPLRIAWFSQVIGPDRGLEPFLSALRLIPNIPCALTLVGLCSEESKKSLTNLLRSELHTLTILPPMEEVRLFKFLRTQEIGLALELDNTENRRLCRTNKLYTYPLAGCYTVASMTPSQQQFFEEYPELGTTVNLNNPNDVSVNLSSLFENRLSTFNQREQTLSLAKRKLNWETESSILTTLVTDMLKA